MERQGNSTARPVPHSEPQFVQKTHFQFAAAVPEFNAVDVVSAALLVADAVAADALISGVLLGCGCLPASTLPRNSAPSSIARRSVCTSPVTCPVLQSCTLSRPVTFPSIFPRTITSRAFTSAFTVPFGPIVRLPFVRLSFPSTRPSTNRSSLPVTSPLILIPWLMQAAARGEIGRALEVGLVLAGEPLVVAAGFAEVVEFSATPWGFESSFFHIGHL